MTMTDLTAEVSHLLTSKYAAASISNESTRAAVGLDSFLTEAYQINSSIRSLLAYMRAIRQPYLSTDPPPKRTHSVNKSQTGQPSRSVPGFGEIPTRLTDDQREEIDTSTAALLRHVNTSISNLSSAAMLQHDTASKLLTKKYGKLSTILWRWAAGDGDQAHDANTGKSDEQLREEGEVQARAQFRDGVIWYLNRALTNAVEVQGNMVEVRLEREREKRMSVLYDERNKTVMAPTYDAEARSDAIRANYEVAQHQGRHAMDVELHSQSRIPATNDSIMNELSPDQLQLFAAENNSLLNYYNDTLSKVTQAEKSLMEISSLQQTLVGHLNIQGELVGQLVEDASRTDDNLRRGNKELKKASERGSVAQGFFWTTVGLCSSLVIWDLIF